MNREQTLQLLSGGQDAWRRWAAEIQGKRRALERSGKWATEHDGTPRTTETRDWLTEASADFFSGQCPHIFDTFIDLSGCDFPGPTSFGAAIFKDAVRFARSRFLTFTNFQGATFCSEADFDDARFSGVHPSSVTNLQGANRIPNARFSRNVDFSNARFCGSAGFRKVVFERTVWFNEAVFCQEAWFRQVSFAGDAPFSGATFHDIAWFLEAKFENEAWFKRARFCKSVDFSLSSFRGGATFDWTIFEKSASFRAAQCSGAFSFDSTQFRDVPDFIQSHFAEAPHFDNVSVSKISPDNLEMPSRYRALKRLAIQGHDYAREHEFFVGELKSMRGISYRLYPNPINWLLLKVLRDGDRTPKLMWRWQALTGTERATRVPVWPGGPTGALTYLVGMMYQWLSNFGRSLIRPIFWWLTSTILFTSLYLLTHYQIQIPSSRKQALLSVLTSWIDHLGLSQFSGLQRSTCVAGPGDPLWAALGLSIRRGLVLPGVDSAQQIDQIYACLYGIYSFGSIGTTAFPNRVVPLIPDWIAFLGILQTTISAVLVFLFLLALRNHFRIK